MKKSVKYIIAAAVIVIIAFLYAHVGKKVPVYDKSVDSSLYGNMGELTAPFGTAGVYLRKTSAERHKHYVRNLWKYADIHLSVSDFGRGIKRAAAQRDPDASAVANGKYYTIKFDEIKDCRGQKFIFTLCSQDAASGNALTVYNVPKGRKTRNFT